MLSYQVQKQALKLTQAEKYLIEESELGESEEKDAAGEHEGVFCRFCFTLSTLALASLQEWKTCGTKCLIDRLVSEHRV